MAISNTVCRNILDTKDVINQQIASLLVARLVSNNSIDVDTCGKLSEEVTSCVNQQIDALIDRVQDDFNKHH